MSDDGIVTNVMSQKLTNKVTMKCYMMYGEVFDRMFDKSEKQEGMFIYIVYNVI